MHHLTAALTRGWVLFGFGALASALAVAQLGVLGQQQPGIDSIIYQEVAEQIAKVGYSEALSSHWSPLYPLYLCAINNLSGLGVEHEPIISSLGYAALLLLGCGVAGMFLHGVANLLWPRGTGERLEARAWICYGLGLTLYLLFAVHKVSMRMPDGLVFCLAIAALGCWCRAFTKGLSWRWTFAAGIFSGLGFLARSNVLHWSGVVAIMACGLAPNVSFRRRPTAFVAWFLGLLIFVTPQIWMMTARKGSLEFGNTGRMTFAQVYGVSWPEGPATWPLRLADGDVRVFTERRMVNFPGFYDMDRAYENAKLAIGVSTVLRAFIQAVFSFLLGYWSPGHALLWPLLWATWPLWLMGLGSWRMEGQNENGDPPGFSALRRRMAYLLTCAGLVGIGMHLLSSCYFHYLPAYLFALLVGACLWMLEGSKDKLSTVHACRACYGVALGFALVTSLTTIALFRDVNTRGIKSTIAQTNRLVSAFNELPAPKDGLRRIAVLGEGWLDLYAIRLSASQIYADIPDPLVFSDESRFNRVIEALRQEKVVAVLATVAPCTNRTRENWRHIEGTNWWLLNLDAPAG